MGSMQGDEEYDWVDDGTLDLAETIRRFEQLEPAVVVTRPFAFSSARTTTAGESKVITRSYFGLQQQLQRLT